LARIALEWFDTQLKRKRTDMSKPRSPLHAYELFGGRWTDMRRWPPSTAHARSFYFAAGPSSSGAPSRNDGTLADAPPGGEGTDQVPWNGDLNSPCTRHLYQQSNAVLLVTPTIDNPCFYDDRTFEIGALTYTTAPLAEATDIAGPGAVTVYGSANTTNTEWVVTLSDVAPGGAARPLTTGDLIGSLRALDERRSWALDGRLLMPWHPFTRASEQPVQPGALTRYDIELPAIVARIAAGHRIRLTVQTSDVPYLEPTFPHQSQLFGGNYNVARGGAHASSITLAVMSPTKVSDAANAWGPCVLDCHS
jgi:putative CocE/NonD family hydrolase